MHAMPGIVPDLSACICPKPPTQTTECGYAGPCTILWSSLSGPGSVHPSSPLQNMPALPIAIPIAACTSRACASWLHESCRHARTWHGGSRGSHSCRSMHHLHLNGGHKERKKELHKVQLRVQLRKASVCESTPEELPCRWGAHTVLHQPHA